MSQTNVCQVLRVKQFKYRIGRAIWGPTTKMIKRSDNAFKLAIQVLERELAALKVEYEREIEVIEDKIETLKNTADDNNFASMTLPDAIAAYLNSRSKKRSS